jgi:hypothetical protein
MDTWALVMVSVAVVLLAMLTGFAVGIMSERSIRLAWYQFVLQTNKDFESCENSRAQLKMWMTSVELPPDLEDEDAKEEESE